MSTGEGESMEEAVGVAVRFMSELLVERHVVNDIEYAMLISNCVDVKLVLAWYPPYTVAVAMPLSVLPL
jgi:hypothetical protein